MNKNKEGKEGATTGTFIQIVLIILKLTGKITWPWWQVLIPSIIGVSLILILLLALAIQTKVLQNKKAKDTKETQTL